MAQSTLIAIFRLAAANCLASALPASSASEPRWVNYDRQATLHGRIFREFEMSFVDSDMSPVTDPKEAAKAAKEAQRKGPPTGAIPREPVLHWILRLDKPFSIHARFSDGSEPEERDVSEIDLGNPSLASGNARRYHIPERAFGRIRYQVSGKLWHGCNVHHLRPLMMEFSSIKSGD